MSHSLVRSKSLGPSVADGPLAFTCTLRDSGRDVAWIRVSGELDLVTAPRLRAAFRDVGPHVTRVVLDLRQVSVLDSGGVQVIVEASHALRRLGRRLVLVRDPSQVDRLFELTWVSDALEMVDLSPGEPPVLALLKLAQGVRAA